MNPQNIIIVLILLIILIPAIRSTVKHLKGEGACCGGPKERSIKKKIAGKPVKKLAVHIEGMHCDHCKNRVENALNELDGVVAKVKLAKNTAFVDLYKDVSEEAIREAITKCDYRVTAMETL